MRGSREVMATAGIVWIRKCSRIRSNVASHGATSLPFNLESRISNAPLLSVSCERGC